MESLIFANIEEVERVKMVGLVENERIYFVPNLKLDYNGAESDFSDNILGVSSTIYFWNLILQKQGRRMNEGGVIGFELSNSLFPVTVHIDLRENIAPSLSLKLDGKSNSITYNARKSLKEVLANIDHDKYVIESEFIISDLSSLKWFIKTYFNLGGRPFQANSFYMSTEKPIGAESVKWSKLFRK